MRVGYGDSWSQSKPSFLAFRGGPALGMIGEFFVDCSMGGGALSPDCMFMCDWTLMCDGASDGRRGMCCGSGGTCSGDGR